MINVLDAKDIDQLKEFIFKNFIEAAKKLDTIGEVAVDYESSTVITPTSGSGGNMFDAVYFKDLNTHITRNGTGDLVFTDINAGSITLSQIKAVVDILWTFGDAVGVKFTNAAGAVKRIGLTEDADGITYFNDTGEVE